MEPQVGAAAWLGPGMRGVMRKWAGFKPGAEVRLPGRDSPKLEPVVIHEGKEGNNKVKTIKNAGGAVGARDGKMGNWPGCPFLLAAFCWVGASSFRVMAPSPTPGPQ